MSEVMNVGVMNVGQSQISPFWSEFAVQGRGVVEMSGGEVATYLKLNSPLLCFSLQALPRGFIVL